MIFPLTLTFTKKLEGEIEQYSTAMILTFVRNEFKESDADIVKIIEDSVTADNRLLLFKHKRGGRTNRWGGISNARFRIIMTGSIRKAEYRINLTRILMLGLIVGCIMGILTFSYKIGLLTFIFLGGLNWLIKIIQHWIIFSDILVVPNFLTDGKSK